MVRHAHPTDSALRVSSGERQDVRKSDGIRENSIQVDKNCTLVLYVKYHALEALTAHAF